MRGIEGKRKRQKEGRKLTFESFRFDLAYIRESAFTCVDFLFV